MENSKRNLISRIIEFRKKSRKYPSVLPFMANPTLSNKEGVTDSFTKGTQFESFVVRRFDPDIFTLVEWRSDKSVDGIFPAMSKFPDLEFYMETSSRQFSFAIECKWRETLKNHSFRFDKFHLENYRHYEEATGIKTFVIIGVGNSPQHPNATYIMPLREITNELLTEFDLGMYKRKHPHNPFELDTASFKVF